MRDRWNTIVPWVLPPAIFENVNGSTLYLKLIIPVFSVIFLSLLTFPVKRLQVSTLQLSFAIAKFFTLMPQKQKKCLIFFQVVTAFSCKQTKLLSRNIRFHNRIAIHYCHYLANNLSVSSVSVFHGSRTSPAIRDFEGSEQVLSIPGSKIRAKKLKINLGNPPKVLRKARCQLAVFWTYF